MRLPDAGLNWEQMLPAPGLALPGPAAPDGISFSSSRPAEDLFPMEAFRRSCEEVLAGPDASAVLQLGSPSGYAPLRHHLLDAGAPRRSGAGE